MPHPWESQWTIIDRLGGGGQGLTYRVERADEPRVVGALKHLKNNKSPQARGRMRREVVNLQTLAGAGGYVPKVLSHNVEAFEDLKTELFVVMELIVGPTLTDYVANHHVSVDEALRFALSLCRTVKIAHTFPILHRDLKPDNIILRGSPDPELVIVDYGLSFNLLDEQLTAIDETFRNRFLDLPETNTPTGDRRDPRSDITAICAILYFCLTGEAPVHLMDANGLLPHMRRGLSVRDAHGEDDRVRHIEDLLTRGFAPIISNRFQTVDDLTAKLTELITQSEDLESYDPVQLAAALSNQLRSTNRATQIGAFSRDAKKIDDFLLQQTREYQSKLGEFSVVAVPPRFKARYDLPAGLDLVLELDYLLILSVQHHSLTRVRKHVVASRDTQCVLLAVDYIHDRSGHDPPVATSGCKEILWYEADAEAIFPNLAIAFDDWLKSEMRDLAKLVSVSDQGRA